MMREISIIIIISYLITITFPQTSDKYAVFEPLPRDISIKFPIPTVLKTEYTVKCEFNTLLDNGYSNATFSGIPQNASSISESFNVTISPLTAGRARSFVCVLSNSSNSNISTVTKFLLIRPALEAQVCENATVFNGSEASFTIKLPPQLPDNTYITCLGTNTTALAGLTTVKITYSPINDLIQCTLIVPSSSKDFNVSVTFINPTIYFSPSVVESNSPIIRLNLISNFSIGIVNCTISSNSNVTDCSFTNEGNWTLSPNQFVFSNASSKILTMTRTGSIPISSENYYVRCCSINSPLVARATVTIKNSSFEYPVTSNATETNYGDLQFTRLSDCPCDLTVGICDQNCCCDSFCNCSSGVNRFNGPYGGYFSDPLPRSCNYQDDLTRQPYQSLLCVVNESPNIIGDYYSMQSIVNDYTTLSNMLTSSSRNSGFQIKTTDVPSSTSSFIAISTNSISTTLTPKYLYLPRQVIDSSKCDLRNQIVMLQPYDSICSYNVTRSTCESTTDPRLNSLFYLQSTTSMETNCNNKMAITAVSNIPVFTFYYCSENTACPWDNGYILPPSPRNNIDGCTNVVDSVSYVIYYNETGAVYINANINIRNISFNGTLDQRFTVSFVSTTSTRETADIQSFPYLKSILNLKVASISGLYGYDDGMPIIASNTSSTTNYSYLKTLPISVSGNCDKNGNNVRFRQDSLVQCKFDISNKTCNDNKNSIKSYLDSFVNSNYVAIYGNPSSPNDFILINREQVVNTSATSPYYPTNQNTNLKNPINDMSGYCANVTTGLTLTIYYSRQGKARGQYIYNIVSVVSRYQYINVSYYKPVGSNDNVSNSLMLTVYHSFVLVSSNIAGTQSTDNNAQAVCLFDICINELFYPWMYNYEGKQGFYEESFGLFLLGLAIFLLVTTYPWW